MTHLSKSFIKNIICDIIFYQNIDINYICFKLSDNAWDKCGFDFIAKSDSLLHKISDNLFIKFFTSFDAKSFDLIRYKKYSAKNEKYYIKQTKNRFTVERINNNTTSQLCKFNFNKKLLFWLKITHIFTDEEKEDIYCKINEMFICDREYEKFNQRNFLYLQLEERIKNLLKRRI